MDDDVALERTIAEYAAALSLVQTWQRESEGPPDQELMALRASLLERWTKLRGIREHVAAGRLAGTGEALAAVMAGTDYPLDETPATREWAAEGRDVRRALARSFGPPQPTAEGRERWTIARRPVRAGHARPPRSSPRARAARARRTRTARTTAASRDGPSQADDPDLAGPAGRPA